MVLLPAFPLWSNMWEQQIEELSEDFRVIAVDPRGFGASPPLPKTSVSSPSLDLMADDVDALLEHLRVPKAVIAGISMGGYGALAFAKRHPDRLAGLILADTRASADSVAAKDARVADARYVERATALEPAERARVVFERICAQLLRPGCSIDPALIELRRRWTGEVEPTSIAWALRAMANRPDTHEVLTRAKVPVLIIAGAQDEVIDPAEGEKMFRALPEGRGRMVVIPGANHLSNLEQPDDFNAAVREFRGVLAVDSEGR